MSDCFPTAMATVTAINTTAIPEPYATRVAMPDTKDPRVTWVATTVRNTGRVHDNEATAYETPKRNTERYPRPDAALLDFGSPTFNS